MILNFFYLVDLLEEIKKMFFIKNYSTYQKPSDEFQFRNCSILKLGVTLAPHFLTVILVEQF